MKIVINDCYGGFSLSVVGTLRYAELKGITLYKMKADQGIMFYTTPEFKSESYFSTFLRDIPRTDPCLIQTLEELGKEANGPHADLFVVDIPAGTHYRIHEYDGSETIEYRDQIKWSIAT